MVSGEVAVDLHGALVKPAEQQRTEMNRLDLGVDFLEADVFLVERLGDEQPAVIRAAGLQPIGPEPVEEFVARLTADLILLAEPAKNRSQNES
jgi:hypothetical protein